MDPRLDIPSLLDVYTRPYEKKMLEWRRLGALDKVSNIIDILGPRSSSLNTVLEVGAGTGQVLEMLAQKRIGNKHTGIEIGDARLGNATTRTDIDFQYYNGRQIPFPDNSFDFVYATHVLEHVVYEREFLHEISRVAKELVYIEVPLEIHARTSWAALNKSLQIGHINAYDLHSFLLKLETSGLSVIDYKVFDHSPAILRFTRSPFKAFALTWLRRAGTLGNIGSNIMTYHCGALCKPSAKLDIA